MGTGQSPAQGSSPRLGSSQGGGLGATGEHRPLVGQPQWVLGQDAQTQVPSYGPCPQAVSLGTTQPAVTSQAWQRGHRARDASPVSQGPCSGTWSCLSGTGSWGTEAAVGTARRVCTGFRDAEGGWWGARVGPEQGNHVWIPGAGWALPGLSEQRGQTPSPAPRVGTGWPLGLEPVPGLSTHTRPQPSSTRCDAPAACRDLSAAAPHPGQPPVVPLGSPLADPCSDPRPQASGTRAASSAQGPPGCVRSTPQWADQPCFLPPADPWAPLSAEHGAPAQAPQHCTKTRLGAGSLGRGQGLSRARTPAPDNSTHSWQAGHCGCRSAHPPGRHDPVSSAARDSQEWH